MLIRVASEKQYKSTYLEKAISINLHFFSPAHLEINNDY